MKIKLEKICMFFFFVLPFVDIITALTTRLIELPVSLGIIIKGLYTVVLTLYILFYINTKEKKCFLYYLCCIALYCLFFVLTKNHLLWNSNLFVDFIALYKYLFTGLILFAYIVIYKNNDSNDMLKKVMFYTLICYTVLLLIPQLTNTSFRSYVDKPNNEGEVGWFYAANEISAIILILFPFYFSKLKTMIMDKKYWYLLLIIPIVFSIYNLGTKTSWYGLILLSIVIFIIYLIKERENKKMLVFSVLLIMSLFLLNFNSPANNNFNKSLENKSKVVTNEKKDKDPDEKDFSKCGEYHKIKEVVSNEKIVKVVHVILSGRENKAYTQFLIYKDASIPDKFFGVGFVDNKDISNCYMEKYIEIDLLDGLIHYGVLGLLLILFPYFYAIKGLKILNIRKLDSTNCIYLFTFVLLFGLSFVAGHILGYPTPSIYLNLLLIIIINEINYLKSI